MEHVTNGVVDQHISLVGQNEMLCTITIIVALHREFNMVLE
jgi:hypothetical protein